MCASTSEETISHLNRNAKVVLAAVEKLTANDATGRVPDETAQHLLLAAIRLFAHKVDKEHRRIRPVPASATINATEVAVAITELMRVADLNVFDLAMWAGRTSPGERS